MRFLYSAKQLNTQAICRCFAGPTDCCKVNTHPCMNSNGCPSKEAIWGHTSQTLSTPFLLAKLCYFVLMRCIAGLGKWVPGFDSPVRWAAGMGSLRAEDRGKWRSHPKGTAVRTVASYLLGFRLSYKAIGDWPVVLECSFLMFLFVSSSSVEWS